MSRNSRLENASYAEIDAAISELEVKLDRLKVAYERYFSGIDRTPPDFLRKDVSRILRMLENSFIRNTAQKFRLNTCSQKFSTYSNYWNRVQRQIEEGTFKRHLQKAQRNEQRRTRPVADEDERDDIYELDLDMDFDADAFMDSLDDHFDTVTNQSGFDQTADTVFDRSTGPTQLTPSAFDRAQQAPTVVAPTAFDRAQQEPTVRASIPNQTDENASEAEQRQAKLDAMRRRLEERRKPTTITLVPPAFSRDRQEETRIATSEVPGMPTGGADYDKLRKLRQMKQRMAEQTAEHAQPAPARPRVVQRSSSHPAADPARSNIHATGPQRVIQRRTETPQTSSPNNDHAREVYNRLVAAKKHCNEPTENLSFEAVKTSMEQQRERLKQTRGATNVDFQVVIKDGKAYLKPETKK